MRPPPKSTLFPYTTLFRSEYAQHGSPARRCETGVRRRLDDHVGRRDRKSTRLNSSHVESSYAVFCLKKNIRYEDRHAGSLSEIDFKRDAPKRGTSRLRQAA